MDQISENGDEIRPLFASPSNGFKSSFGRRNIELVFLFVSDDSLDDEKVESLLVVHS